MKSSLPILTLALAISSCTTAYKSGQTPDDVYFSPARPQEEYVRMDDRNDQEYRYWDEGAYRDDRYLRMKIRDHRYESLFYDYYSYNPYYYHYYNSYLDYNSPFSPVTYWDYYYSPYHGPVLSCTPRTRVSQRPRVFDLNVYNPPTPAGTKLPRVLTSSEGHGYNPAYQTPRSSNDNYRGSGSNAGEYLRGVFGSSGSSSSSSSSSSPSFKTSGSSSGSSGSSGSSSGSTNAPARKF